MITLYYSPGTCALACWIALEWAGADYQAVRVSASDPQYKKINPLAQVPALDIGAERAMGQNGAILNYIARRFPLEHLGSKIGFEEHFKFDEVMDFLTGDFHPAFWPYFAPKRYTTQKDARSVTAAHEASFARIERVMQYLDGQIAENSGHVYAGRRSVADAYAFIMCRWTARLDKSWKDYPNIAAFMAMMQKDEAVQMVLEQSSRD